jgi:hypothetical protein
MNTVNSETNTGAVENSTAVNNQTKTVKRGRPINPDKTRKVYLVKNGEAYSVRGKGAPKPGSETYFTIVQRNTKSKDFVFNPETMTVQTETVANRVYKPKAAKTEVTSVATATSVPTVSESVGAQVTQSEDTVIVDAPVNSQQVAVA